MGSNHSAIRPGTYADVNGLHCQFGKVKGEGAFGRVYQGTLVSSDDVSIIALKVAHDQGGGEELFREKKIFEDAGVSTIRRAAVIRAVDNFTDPVSHQQSAIGIYALVEGDRLSTLSQKASLPEVAAVMAQMASSVRDAHRQGLCHLDMKMENALIDKKGEVNVIDWGGVEKIGDTHKAMKGTPYYIAPEVAQSAYGKQIPITGKEDVYSIAMTGHFLINNKHHRDTYEFQANKNNIAGLVQYIANDKSVPECPDTAMRIILQRAAHPDPKQRSSALDLMTDLAIYPEAMKTYNEEEKEAVMANLLKRNNNWEQRRVPGEQKGRFESTIAREIAETLPNEHPRKKSLVHLGNVTQTKLDWAKVSPGQAVRSLEETIHFDGKDWTNEKAPDSETSSLPIFEGPRR